MMPAIDFNAWKRNKNALLGLYGWVNTIIIILNGVLSSLFIYIHWLLIFVRKRVMISFENTVINQLWRSCPETTLQQQINHISCPPPPPRGGGH